MFRLALVYSMDDNYSPCPFENKEKVWWRHYNDLIYFHYFFCVTSNKGYIK